MISIVVAADLNGAIGAKNKIPWRVRDDLVKLKQLTLGHPVILGRKSYDSMLWYYAKSNRPMPGRVYIVVTRNPEYQPERDDARVAHSIEEAVDIARSLGDESIMVIGGGAIFDGALPQTDRVYLTEIQTKVDDVDAYFSPLNLDEWQELSREHHVKNDRNEFDYDDVVYERR
jgi:dihydrofolate reductase